MLSIGLARNPAENTDATAIMDLTPYFATWRHSTRSIGGNWHGEGEFIGSRSDREVFFLQHLGKRIVAADGGRHYYEGQIVRMELTKDGQTFVRSMENMANRVKVIYSKIGGNLLPNGNVESASWFTYGTPSTIASTTTWWASGSRAMHIISDAKKEGAVAGSAITIEPSRAYNCSMITNVASGGWTLRVTDAATSATIADRATAGCGRTWLQCQIPDSNATSIVDVQILSAASDAEVYADGALLRLSPVRGETKWWEDTSSIDEFGRIEAVILEREMTDDESDALAQRALAENAWGRTKPARQGRQFTSEDMPEDSLTVVCRGMAWTLAWRHTLVDGTDQADNHITALMDESEFISSTNAAIDTNTTEAFIESGNPTPVWREMEKIIKDGDDSGNSWMGGVYPGCQFRYEQRPTGTQYQYVRGRMEYYGGGVIPPLEFTPGWCLMADMPAEPAPPTGTDDDPRRVWLDETWFVYENGTTRLEWSFEED